jgi:hypothetical protein
MKKAELELSNDENCRYPNLKREERGVREGGFSAVSASAAFHAVLA